jgi:methyl-accepting chemotaxis protein
MNKSIAFKIPTIIIACMTALISFIGVVTSLSLYRYVQNSIRDKLLVGSEGAVHILGNFDYEGIDSESAAIEPAYAYYKDLASFATETGVANFYVLRKKGDSFEFILDSLSDPRDGEAMADLFTPYREAPDELFAAAEAGTAKFTAKPYTDEFGSYQSVFLPVVGENGAVRAVIGADLEVAGIRRSMMSSILVGILPSFVADLILSILILSALRRIVVKPIKEIDLALRGIAEGEADLRKRLPRRSNDELGRLSMNFNFFVDRLNAMIAVIKEQVSNVETVQGRLASGARETSLSISTINENVGEIAGSMSELDGRVNAMQGLTERVSELSESLSATASLFGTASDESAMAIKDILRDVGEISETADAFAGLEAELALKSESGIKRMNETDGVVRDINERIEDIHSMLEVINAISAETNILAMNAAIEAAHAGAAGKGFAVVASEIRKLADDSKANAAKIGATLGDIIARMQEAGRLTGATRESLMDIDASVARNEEAFALIRGKARDVARDGGSVSERLDMMRKYGNETREETRSILESMKELHGSGLVVKRLSGEVSNGTGAIALGVSDITRAFRGIAEDSELVSDINRSIRGQIERFKTGNDAESGPAKT